MNRPSSYIKRFGGRSLPIFLALVFTLVLAGSGVAPSNDIGGSNKQDTTRQVVRNLIQVGKGQYEGRLYDQAEKMLTIAQSYQEYLSATERDYLNELLGKARVAAAKRRRVDESFSKAKELIDKGRLLEARSELQRVRGNETLSKEEQQQLVDALKMLDDQMSQQKSGPAKITVEETVPPGGRRVEPAPVKPSGPVGVEAKKVAELYHRSMGYYYAGELEKAREGFIEVIASGLIPSPMVKTLQGHLLRIDARLAEEAKSPTTEEPATDETKAMEDLYNKSVELYISGEFDQARAGFIKVAASGLYSGPEGRGPADYLALIESLTGEMFGPKPFPKETTDMAELLKIAEPERDVTEVIEPNIVAEVIEPNIVAEVIEPNVLAEVIEPNLLSELIEPNVVGADVNEPKAVEEEAKGGYIEVILQKRNILRSHTKAVVRDAAERARSHVSAGEFGKARRLVESAQLTVNENKFYLGDDLHKEYTGRLAEVGDEISAKEAEEELNRQERARQEAIRAQREFRMKTEQERRDRIAELMRNAKTYQKQQRYEAALGQLESLIALDPQNDDALTLRDTLSDMVYMRKQLEVQKEGDKQRADILLKTDESGIPYAEEITYPKNWREIIEKPTRKPEPPIGLDEADAAVYEQLNQIVDLSELTQDTPFNEAVEVMKRAVDPPLKIVVIWRDLYENADIEPTRPINMDGLSAVQLGTGLENLLKAVAGGVTGTLSDLGYVVERGIITVATVDTLPSKMETRVYDITDLVGEPANFRGMGGGMMGMGMGMGGYGMGGYGMGGMGGYGMGGMGGYGMGGMGGYGGYGGGGYGGYGGGGYGGYGGGGYGGYGGGYGGGGYGGYGGGYGGYGGGGGYGGYGGGGYGGYGGGGYGGYGGGGYGGYGGGGYGGYGGGYGGDSGYRAMGLVDLIMETIEPESWYELSDTGEGTITLYPRQQPKKLAVLQTREVHQEIEKLLAEMRKALGYQVSIETRFLVVSENFLEDIGLDVDFLLGSAGGLGDWGPISIEQGSFLSTSPDVSTKVPGSLGGISAAATVAGGYGSILDDLTVAYILRATQAHTDAKALTAPKVTVLSGESATFSVQNDVSYALPPDVTTTGAPGSYTGGSWTQSSVMQNIQRMQVGSMVNITPIISHDKKNVLLFIVTQLQDLLRMKSHIVEGPVGDQGEVVQYTVTVPETEYSQVMTRVSVPDSGTLLLGGQKITAEVEKEAGVPVLNKIPVVGRLFSNRSMTRDHKILLILVKPVIILQEEREAEAIAAMENGF